MLRKSQRRGTTIQPVSMMNVPMMKYILAMFCGAMGMHIVLFVRNNNNSSSSMTSTIMTTQQQLLLQNDRQDHFYNNDGDSDENDNDNDDDDDDARISSSETSIISSIEERTNENHHAHDDDDDDDDDGHLHPFLPEKIFTIVGLESSGTTFMTRIIGQSLGLKTPKNDLGKETMARGISTSYVVSSNNNPNNINNPNKTTTAVGSSSSNNNRRGYRTEVLHVSLPWGSFCTKEPTAYEDSIVPVIYPTMCMRNLRAVKQEHNKRKEEEERLVLRLKQKKLSKPQLVVRQNEWNECQRVFMNDDDRLPNQQLLQPTLFPNRYFLNVTSHMEWYKRWGVDSHLIIVIRDTTISQTARHEHCSNPILLQKEEQTGKDIISHAIRTYIVKDLHDHPYDPMHHHHHHHHDMTTMMTTTTTTTNSSSPGPSPIVLLGSKDRKVLLVSYEMLNQFQYQYLKLIYEFLGIQSNFNPQWKDGNKKYIS